MTSGSTSESKSAREEREELLMRLYNATLRASVSIMEDTPPGELTAPTLNAVSRFLSENNVTRSTLEDREKAAEVGAHVPFASPPSNPTDFEYG